jgi:hypothetical protein
VDTILDNLDNDLSTWTLFWTTWTMICPLGHHSGQSGHYSGQSGHHSGQCGHHSGQRHILMFLMKPNIFPLFVYPR